MATTVHVDWTALRDGLQYVVDPYNSTGLDCDNPKALANEMVSCIRSGRHFDVHKFPGLLKEEAKILCMIDTARAAILAAKAG